MKRNWKTFGEIIGRGRNGSIEAYLVTADDDDGDILSSRRAIQFFWDVTPCCMVNSSRPLERP